MNPPCKSVVNTETQVLSCRSKVTLMISLLSCSDFVGFIQEPFRANFLEGSYLRLKSINNIFLGLILRHFGELRSARRRRRKKYAIQKFVMYKGAL